MISLVNTILLSLFDTITVGITFAAVVVVNVVVLAFDIDNINLGVGITDTLNWVGLDTMSFLMNS